MAGQVGQSTTNNMSDMMRCNSVATARGSTGNHMINESYAYRCYKTEPLRYNNSAKGSKTVASNCADAFHRFLFLVVHIMTQ